MLGFGGVGSGRQENGCIVIILGAIIAPLSHPSMSKRASSLSLLSPLAVSIPTLSCYPHLFPPTLSPFPHLLFFCISPPHNNAMALLQSISPFTTIITVIVLLGIVILVIGCVLRGASCCKIAADIVSFDIVYTIGVCGRHVWQ